MKKIVTARKKKRFKNLPLLLIALPGILYLIINNYIPMFGVFLAFKDYSLMKGFLAVTGAVLRILNFYLKQKMHGL